MNTKQALEHHVQRFYHDVYPRTWGGFEGCPIPGWDERDNTVTMNGVHQGNTTRRFIYGYWQYTYNNIENWWNNSCSFIQTDIADLKIIDVYGVTINGNYYDLLPVRGSWAGHEPSDETVDSLNHVLETKRGETFAQQRGAKRTSFTQLGWRVIPQMSEADHATIITGNSGNTRVSRPEVTFHYGKATFDRLIMPPQGTHYVHTDVYCKPINYPQEWLEDGYYGNHIVHSSIHSNIVDDRFAYPNINDGFSFTGLISKIPYSNSGDMASNESSGHLKIYVNGHRVKIRNSRDDVTVYGNGNTNALAYALNDGSSFRISQKAFDLYAGGDVENSVVEVVYLARPSALADNIDHNTTNLNYDEVGDVYFVGSKFGNRGGYLANFLTEEKYSWGGTGHNGTTVALIGKGTVDNSSIVRSLKSSNNEHSSGQILKHEPVEINMVANLGTDTNISGEDGRGIVKFVPYVQHNALKRIDIGFLFNEVRSPWYGDGEGGISESEVILIEPDIPFDVIIGNVYKFSDTFNNKTLSNYYFMSSGNDSNTTYSVDTFDGYYVSGVTGITRTGTGGDTIWELYKGNSAQNDYLITGQSGGGIEGTGYSNGQHYLRGQKYIRTNLLRTTSTRR